MRSSDLTLLRIDPEVPAMGLVGPSLCFAEVFFSPSVEGRIISLKAVLNLGLYDGQNEPSRHSRI
jgi:hypothetical protein